MTESQVPEILDLCWITQHIPSRTFHELSKVIFPESTRNVLQLQIASCHLNTNSFRKEVEEIQEGHEVVTVQTKA